MKKFFQCDGETAVEMISLDTLNTLEAKQGSTALLVYLFDASGFTVIHFKVNLNTFSINSRDHIPLKNG